jgi:hypothetical protein
MQMVISTTGSVRAKLPHKVLRAVRRRGGEQYAADPVAVLKNMSHVTKPGGLISVVVWGPPAQWESGVLFTELGQLMPPAPPTHQVPSPGVKTASSSSSPRRLASGHWPSKTCPTS